jgi:type III restriction enzyme
MITVANRVETAARVKYAFDHGKIRINELRAPERTLHIDSKVLEEAEAQTEVSADTPAEPAAEEEGAPERKRTKQQQAEDLRKVVDTVGQVGQPGERIQNVISVGMLSEGWDARTVTHVMGLRAFSSQLLCEQVVGRGLRRTSYEVNPATGLFDAEYVNIFGVPFTFLPHEGGDDTPPPPPTPKTLVQPLRERAAEFAIAWPNVLRVEHVPAPRLTLDLARVEVLELRASETAFRAEIAPMLAGKPDLTRLSEIDLEEIGRRFRLQTIVFETARDVYDQMRPTWPGNRDHLLVQLIGLVERVLRSDRVRVTPPLFGQDDLRRRIMLTLNMNKIVQHVWEAIRFENTVRLEPVIDTQQPVRSTGDMRPWFTGKPNAPTRRSHVNVCVFDSTWEATEAYALDRPGQRHVAAWVKNDHLDFHVWYVFRGVTLKYRPDFLVRLANGANLVLEVKGQDSDEARAKRRALAEWVQAVNAHGGFGTWACDVSSDPADVGGILERHGAGAAATAV